MSEAQKYVTSQTLLIRVKDKDDHEAWEEFSEIYKPFIIHILAKMNIRGAEQDDVHQEILLRLWKNMVCYKKSDSKFRSWLSVVIRNIVYSYHKSSKRHRAQSLVDSEGNDMDFYEKLSVEPEIDQMIEKEWKGYITKMAFSRIKPLFSDNAIKILQLSLAGKKHAEISESLDIKLSSVKVLKSRVKARFEEEVRSLVANLESES